ncbi:MAG: hypothetical protein ACXVUE_17175 [Solirubrobacteraceae bacterium]
MTIQRIDRVRIVVDDLAAVPSIQRELDRETLLSMLASTALR